MDVASILCLFFVANPEIWKKFRFFPLSPDTTHKIELLPTPIESKNGKCIQHCSVSSKFKEPESYFIIKNYEKKTWRISNAISIFGFF